MSTEPKFRRKTYDATLKARLIAQAFSGKPVSEICKEENIQARITRLEALVTLLLQAKAGSM